jgi:hypothetical protein
MFEAGSSCAKNVTVEGILGLATVQRDTLRKEVEKYCKERSL